jgi:vancomycin resistance protein YoaR
MLRAAPPACPHRPWPAPGGSRLSVFTSESSSTTSSKGRLVAVLVGLLVGVGILYGVLVAVSGGGVPRGTSVLGVELGGLTPSGARAKLSHAVAERGARTVAVHVGDSTVQVRPTDLGLSIDAAKTVAVAGERTYNPITLVQRLVGHQELTPVPTLDKASMADFLDGVAADVNSDPKEGGIRFNASTAEVVTPQDGTLLDRVVASQNLQAAFLRGDTDVDLPLKTVTPKVGAVEVQRALTHFARPAVSGPVTLLVGPRKVLVRPSDFTPFLTMEPDAGGHLRPMLDATGLRQELAPKVGGVLVEPKDARIVIAKDRPKIIPSRDGRTLDAQGLSAALLKVLPKTSGRTASVSLAMTPATFSTADAKALGIKKVISTFTQHFPYAPYRVQNIGQAGRYINGTLLKPGDTFSMNKTVKERTFANGYTVGTVIALGRFREELGGGVSTITTAMWHTAFYAGVQRVEQRAHSFYISRYLPGLEATVAWGNLDLKFKNDAPTGILITTKTTNDNVTITMWGTKRYDIGAIFGPETNVRAFQTVYDPSAGCVAQGGVNGFAITVVRVFHDLTGKVVKREPLTSHYNPAAHIICGPKPGAKPKPSKSKPSKSKPSKSASPKPSSSSSPKPKPSPT